MSEHRQERKVLIGYDGSRNSEDALVLGRLFAEVLAAKPLVATVVLYPDHLIQGEEQETIAARRAAPVQDVALDRLQRLDPEAIAVAADSTAHALHELAEREGPLLVALGSTHRSPVGRVLLGSVGESLLSGAPCAIAVAPCDYARRQEHRLARIGVAVNGSGESWSAFAAAASMAARVHAALTAISVAEPPRYGYGASLAILTGAEYESAEHKHATEVLAEAEARVRPGVPFTPLLAQWSARERACQGRRGA